MLRWCSTNQDSNRPRRLSGPHRQPRAVAVEPDRLSFPLFSAHRTRPATLRRAWPDSRLPYRTNVLALIIDIDMSVAEWQPEGDGALDRLARLRQRSRAPQDCELLDGCHLQLERWAVTAVEMLGAEAYSAPPSARPGRCEICANVSMDQRQPTLTPH